MCRPLIKPESDLVSALIDAGGPKWMRLKADLSSTTVSEMDDGGMGSLLFGDTDQTGGRRLGEQICEAELTDSDGVPVSVVLNVDEKGQLLELDVWKVDFSKLADWPRIDQLRFVSIGPTDTNVGN